MQPMYLRFVQRALTTSALVWVVCAPSCVLSIKLGCLDLFRCVLTAFIMSTDA